nr:unnamed protein product [Callosobruchus analis]
MNKKFSSQKLAKQILFESGLQILLAVYNAPKFVNSIDHLRYAQYVMLTKLNKPVQLTSLPPTSGAAHQHFNRVYYQVQTWLGYDLEHQEFGWTMRSNLVRNPRNSVGPAPDELLNTIFCKCKSDCGLRCGFRKAELQCSLACGQCNAQACLNALAYETDVNEDRTFDPEIMEELETNVIEDDHEDSNELEISELREHDDYEEDKN